MQSNFVERRFVVCVQVRTMHRFAALAAFVVAALLSCSVVCAAAAAPPSQQDIDAFARTLSGLVLQQGSADYAKAISIDNGRTAIQQRPLLVVQPRVDADVPKAIAFAQRFQLAFTVKGGGHSAAGYALNTGGLMLHMARFMTGMSLDAQNEVVTLQAGAIWDPGMSAAVRCASILFIRLQCCLLTVYTYLDAHGFAPVGGGCVTVGVAGFHLGAGFSFISRSYGLGIDNVVSYAAVLANGTQLLLSDTAGPAAQDLWWAMRGAGGGNFAVLTSLTIKVCVRACCLTFLSPLSWTVLLLRRCTRRASC